MDPVRFFNTSDIQKADYTFVIIISRFQGKWIWVRHKERRTWELPAGHVEPGETPLEAANRELFEETGALTYAIRQIVSYEGIYLDKPVFGMIFLAEVSELGPLPDYEIGETGLFTDIPKPLTYPEIQTAFVRYLFHHNRHKSTH